LTRTGNRPDLEFDWTLNTMLEYYDLYEFDELELNTWIFDTWIQIKIRIVAKWDPGILKSWQRNLLVTKKICYTKFKDFLMVQRNCHEGYFAWTNAWTKKIKDFKNIYFWRLSETKWWKSWKVKVNFSFSPT